jgi:hypothetical protein
MSAAPSLYAATIKPTFPKDLRVLLVEDNLVNIKVRFGIYLKTKCSDLSEFGFQEKKTM